MRMLLLAGVAALVVLGAVVLVGLRVVGDDEPGWAERANAACEGGVADTKALIGAANTADTADERALRIYAGSVEVEAGVLARLEGLPRPSEDEVAIEQTLRVISESHRDDLALVRQLRARYDAEVLRQRLTDVEPLLPYLRTSFGSLGADQCVVYYDPATYE
jgi:hypothetical protein